MDQKKSMGRPLSKKNYKKIIEKLESFGVLSKENVEEIGFFIQELLAFDPEAKCCGELLQRKIDDTVKRRQKIKDSGKSTYEGAPKLYYHRKKAEKTI